MLSGDNGILQKATLSKEKTEKAEIIENAKLDILAKISEKNGENITEDELVEILTSPNYDTQGTLSNEESVLDKMLTSKNGKYTIPVSEIYNETLIVTPKIKIGDYVDYDPTYLDVNKTQKVEESKLIYISPTGTATDHGNGYITTEEGGGQKFTAKSDLNWRVLSLEDNKIEIIPSSPIKKDDISQNSGKFVLKGAIGYLYAEQELNEICKIYGYGYGSDTSNEISFKIGGPYLGEETTRTIVNSGARSIKVEDINKIVGVLEDKTDRKIKYKDGSIINTSYTSSYGDTTYPKYNQYYPTINTTLGNSITGISKTQGIKNLMITTYKYSNSNLLNTQIPDFLLTEDYWLASRCLFADSNSIFFYIRDVRNSGWLDFQYTLCTNESNKQEMNPSFYVCPIVSINANYIDTSNVVENTGTENNAWKLK